MAKNKNRKRHVAPVFPAPLAIILLVVSGLALTYLWLNGRCDELGLRLKSLEKERDSLHRKVLNEEYKWSNLTSPQNMQKLLEAHGLTMTWPSEKNVVRIGHPASASGRMLAQHHQFAQDATTMVHD